MAIRHDSNTTNLETNLQLIWCNTAQRPKTSSDAGAFLLREVLENLGQQLPDDRYLVRVQLSLPNQLSTLLIQRTQDWNDLSDTQTLAN